MLIAISFGFSPTDVQKTCNMSKSTYDRARQELLQKGYLKQDGNQYNFFANKQDAKEDSIKLARKLSILVERIKDEGGNIDKYEILKEKMSNIQDSNEKIRLVKEYCEIADRELNDIYNKKIEEKLNI